MHSDTTIHELYETICSEISKGCIRTDYEELGKAENLLVILPGDPGRYMRFRKCLQQFCLKTDLALIVQKDVISKYKEVDSEKEKMIMWDGGYTGSVLDEAEKYIRIGKTDAFIFFCGKPLNLRNANIMEIAAELSDKTKGNCKTYAVASDNDIYVYPDIKRLSAAYSIYMNMNAILEGRT